MRKPDSRTFYAVGLIEQSDDRFLIVRAHDDSADRVWHFPRGPAQPGEPPEAAMRRIAREQLGIEVETLIGQPPVSAEIAGKPVEVRHFFCAVLGGELQAGPYAEIRWVPKSQLREYEYDACTKPVVEWLVSQ